MDRDGTQNGGELFTSGLHQWCMKRARDCQRDGLAVRLFDESHGSIARGLVARENRIAGAEIVGDPHLATCPSFGADTGDLLAVQQQRTDHSRRICIRRSLHGFTARLHDTQSIFKGHRPRKRQRGVFAQTESGCERATLHNIRAICFQRFQCREATHEQRGLTDHRCVESLRRA